MQGSLCLGNVSHGLNNNGIGATGCKGGGLL
jgi:hypothetical protein